METTTYTAFDGCIRVASAETAEALRSIKRYRDGNPDRTVLIFDDATGTQIDFDFRGTEEDVLARAFPPPPKPGRGRPALGVVCGEVSLLPRHWDWLRRQGTNASATLRRLVDDAIRNEPASARAKRALEAADREMWALAGNLPGCEEASRTLYARDFVRFRDLIRPWPEDVRNHLSNLAGRAE